MRLKQLSMVVLLVGWAGILGQAATSQLTGVNIASQGNTTSVTLRLNGAFTHNEYRPTDTLLLVDLVGVSADDLQERSRVLKAPGIRSYHVTGYSGSKGSPISRLELTLDGQTEVQVKGAQEGLVITVVSGPLTSQPQLAVGSRKSSPASANSATLESTPQLKQVAVRSGTTPITVRNVSVDRGADQIDVNIFVSGPLTPNVFKVTDPDRIVVDLPNSEPGSRARALPVEAFGVKGVRVGRLQDNPPVTRVVLDLSVPCDFELVPGNNRVALRVHPSTETTIAKPPALPSGQSLEPRAVAEATPKADLPQTVPAPATASPSDSKPVVPRASVPVAAATPVKMSEGAPVVTAVPEVKNPEVKKMEAAPSAGNFVVVEPNVQQHVSEKSPESQTVQIAAANPPAVPVAGNSSTAPAPQSVAANQNQSGPASQTQIAAASTAEPKADPVKQRGINFAADQQQEQALPQPDNRPKYTGEPISVNLKDVDLKDFFRLIHEISGLNVVLDPNVSGSLTLVLDDVPWDQALDIVLKNNGLDKQLDGTVLRVATRETLRLEAEARRHQIEAQNLAVDKVTATRFLSYAHAKDVMPTVKKLLSSRGDVVADERTNALVISDIPGVIAGIDNLLVKLDRKTLQVEIEARVVSATRSFARDLGVQLGFGFGNASTSVGGASAVGTTPTQVGYIYPPGYTTTPGISAPTSGAPTATFASIPLFSNLGAVAPTSGLSLLNLGGAYRVDAVLTASEQRGLLKVLSRPRIITQSNVQAAIKQGSRIPITTLGQLGGPPTVNYVDAVLRLTVTPQITVENTIFLNVDIENTTPDFSNEIQGNPVFLTQQTTTQVLVANGGTVVIGGVIQSQNSLNTQQIPLLGSIPYLGNLFKHRSVSTSTQELIFFITPRIVES